MASIALGIVWIVYAKRNSAVQAEIDNSQRLLDQLKANYSSQRSVQHNYAGIS